MSKGTTVRPVRIADDLWDRMNFTIAHRNANTAHEPWSVSEFIRVACEYHIKKMARSRKRPVRLIPTKTVDQDQDQDQDRAPVTAEPLDADTSGA